MVQRTFPGSVTRYVYSYSYLCTEKAYIVVDGIKYVFVHKEIPFEVAADVTPFTVRYILFGMSNNSWLHVSFDFIK